MCWVTWILKTSMIHLRVSIKVRFYFVWYFLVFYVRTNITLNSLLCLSLAKLNFSLPIDRMLARILESVFLNCFVHVRFTHMMIDLWPQWHAIKQNMLCQTLWKQLYSWKGIIGYFCSPHLDMLTNLHIFAKPAPRLQLKPWLGSLWPDQWPQNLPAARCKAWRYFQVIMEATITQFEPSISILSW